MMTTSKELLFVDPDKERSPFLLTKSQESDACKNTPPRIARVELPNVLSQVKDFLPVMAAANRTLENELTVKDSKTFDIENIKEDEDYVEMSIGLYGKESETSSDEDSDEEQICKMFEEITEKTIKFTRGGSDIGSDMITELKNDKNSNVKSLPIKKKTKKTHTCRK